MTCFNTSIQLNHVQAQLRNIK